ncbi:hypothetical protein JX265_003678 [Neoarthrinium moseri]|uniref:C2H2-type domain-containing protein n=1 Tax=Neoarthrinium moseri TaxID=1658444 RepID=A0A9Q0ASG1_9PEZI|nr:hypothetical protein JX265_003678 [Neoarthrinium moseri]
MLSTLPRSSHLGPLSIQPSLLRLPSQRYPDSLNSRPGIRHKPRARSLSLWRKVKNWTAKATSNATSHRINPKYALVVTNTSTQPLTANIYSSNFALKAEDENLTRESNTPPVSRSVSLAKELTPQPTDSLAMTSKAASTSRGGNHHSTSQSFIDAYLSRRKRDEINKLMEMLEEWIDSPAFVCHAPGVGGSTKSTNTSRASSSSNSSSRNVAGQKRSHRRDSFDSSDPGRDGNGDDKRDNKRSRVSSSPALKLACPFFKRDPTKYSNRQACTGPGWTSLARLKEHIYRAHKQPDNKCNRCCEAFQTGELLEEHQRADEPCRKSTDNFVDGISESQYHQLRKKPVGTKTNAERWEDVYRIIFPKASTIPSPYYEYDDGKRTPEYRDEDIEFTEFMKNQLIEGVRNDLEDHFDQFTAETRKSFVNIIRTRFSQLVQQFKEQHKPPQTDGSKEAAPVKDLLYNLPEIPVFEDLGNEWMQGLELDIYQADPNKYDFTYSSDVSDSAYFSMDSPRSSTKC